MARRKKNVLGPKWKILEVSVSPKNQAYFNCSAVHKGSQLGPFAQFGAALLNQDSLWIGWERDPHWIVSAMAPTHKQQAPTTVSLGTSWLYKTASLLEAFKVSWSSSYSDFCQSRFLESQDQVYWTRKRLITVPNLNLISSFFVFILQPKSSELTHPHTAANTHTFHWLVTTDHLSTNGLSSLRVWLGWLFWKKAFSSLWNWTPFPNGDPQAAVGVFLSAGKINECISPSLVISILFKRRNTLTFTIKLAFEALD